MPERDTFLLTLAGTTAIHLVLLVLIDAGGVYARRLPGPRAPRIELIDVEHTPPPPPPPPPVAKAVEPEQPIDPPKVRIRAPAKAEPVPVARPEPAIPPDPDAGGAPVVTLDNVGVAARGVPVAVGRRTSPRVGQGGTGTGTGAGQGAGTAPTPMSVATIKTAAKPRGDYGYFNAATDYPAEARRQRIEGQLRVRLLVDATGKVVQRRVLQPGLGHGLDDVALARAAKFEFDPAVDTTGAPVASVVVWTFTFTLPE